ncbi:MAG TPA: hypothetical protein VKY33_00485 [Flavobacterium sp.]|nr:hypothetical protein [Flavobacterium sp.]
MKKTLILLSGIFILVACNKKNEQHQEEVILKTKKKIDFERFETARVVNKTTDVPFVVYAKDSLLNLYTRPNENAVFIQQTLTEKDTLYGETEVSNFYKIIYQVEQNPENSRYAYVLKSDVNKDNELLLTEKDSLNEIKSAKINGIYSESTTFDAIGNVELINKSAYNEAFKNHPQYLLVSNNRPVSDENFFSIKLRNGSLKKVSKKSKNEEITLEYAGYSRDLDRHFFREFYLGTPRQYKAVSTINENIEDKYFADVPVYYKTNHLLASLSNNDTGTLLVIEKYNPQDYSFKELLAVNFTNFKVSTSKNLIWENSQTLLAEIHHPNTRTTSKNYKKQYIRIHISGI